MEFVNIIFILLPILSISGELIKLQDENQILCITDDADSTISILPPVIESGKNTSIFLDDDSNWTDWTLETSTNLVLPQVVDKRFEDFEIIYGDQIYEPKLRSISFSVYSDSIYITTSDVNKKKQLKQTKNMLVSWPTYTTYPSDRLSEFQLNATTPNETYWKVHNYKIRSSTTITKETNSIKLTDENTCVVIYIYLCPNCSLTIAAAGSESNFHGYSENSWKWDKQVINGSSGAEIKFTRKTDHQESTGQWVIDIRKCQETIASKTIYKVSLDTEIHKETNRKCYLDTTVQESKDIFACSEVGVLGDNCDIKCQEFLGNTSMYCQSNEICDNSDIDTKCYCAWGYTGTSCNQTCQAGKYGLSCEKSCGCNECNEQTGECKNSATAHFATTTTLTLLLAIILLQCYN